MIITRPIASETRKERSSGRRTILKMDGELEVDL
jgi:hypothetical protein